MALFRYSHYISDSYYNKSNKNTEKNWIFVRTQ